MLTEKEAATKWCPFARVALPVGHAGNRISTFNKQQASGRDAEWYAQQEADCRCIASHCMAWRRSPMTPLALFSLCDSPRLEIEPPRPPGVPESWEWCPWTEDGAAGWGEDKESYRLRLEGFCGLAGVSRA